MTVPSKPVKATGVADSLAYIHSYIDATEAAAAPYASPALGNIHEALRMIATGGKNLRSELVHIAAAGSTDQAYQAAVAFGACVELLHTSFLVHDDIIDGDDLRRGEETIHALATRRFSEQGNREASRLGAGVGIVSGDLALTWVYDILATADIPAEMKVRAMHVVAGASSTTIYGEILDIEHAGMNNAELDRVRLSNHLKTSVYSFVAPLQLGCIAAGRDGLVMEGIGKHLGMAFQAADDLLGTLGSPADHGKTSTDAERGRATLLTGHMDELSHADAASAVAQEAHTYLEQARELIRRAEFHPDTRAGLLNMTDKIEGMVRRYA